MALSLETDTTPCFHFSDLSHISSCNVSAEKDREVLSHFVRGPLKGEKLSSLRFKNTKLCVNMKVRQNSELMSMVNFRTAVVPKSLLQNTVVAEKMGSGNIAMYRNVSNQTGLISNIFIIRK